MFMYYPTVVVASGFRPSDTKEGKQLLRAKIVVLETRMLASLSAIQLCTSRIKQMYFASGRQCWLSHHTTHTLVLLLWMFSGKSHDVIIYV